MLRKHIACGSMPPERVLELSRCAKQEFGWSFGSATCLRILCPASFLMFSTPEDLRREAKCEPGRTPCLSRFEPRPCTTHATPLQLGWHQGVFEGTLAVQASRSNRESFNESDNKTKFIVGLAGSAVMPPSGRLMSLLDQSIDHQVASCQFHDHGKRMFPLLEDHECSV